MAFGDGISMLLFEGQLLSSIRVDSVFGKGRAVLHVEARSLWTCKGGIGACKDPYSMLE